MTHIVLTGFMGTGKTAVGRVVAERLGRRFLDMDEMIETRIGKPIARIFFEDGEEAFRREESAVIEEFASSFDFVIATGGGSLVAAENRNRMAAVGTVICLTCEPDELVARIAAGTKRPLLRTADPHREIVRLLGERADAYAALPWHVPTTGRSISEVADRVIQIAGALTLPVRAPQGSYEIRIGDRLLDHLGDVLASTRSPRGTTIAVVTSDSVGRLYLARAEAALRETGYRTWACTVEDGESAKTLKTVSELYERLLDGGLDRHSVVLALGGGVVGDLAGFAAATYLRGIRLIQVPTTLLAMIDASVGGKTGVDLPRGKNLVGAFGAPEVVVVDPSVLATLPDAVLRAGTAEAIKHGVVGDPVLFEDLERSAGDVRLWIEGGGGARIARALRVKIDIVEDDPYERGRRAVLNLGHTVGHALERLSGYGIPHGEAVGVGLVAAARLAAACGLATPSLSERIERAVGAWGLPTHIVGHPAATIRKAMAVDKKRRGHRLIWVLPEAIGAVRLVDDVPDTLVDTVLESMGAI